jgi:hypothetical protein
VLAGLPYTANAASMFANSRLSDWCWDSNSSSGMSGLRNIVKLKAVLPSGSATARVGKIANWSLEGPAYMSITPVRGSASIWK